MLDHQRSARHETRTRAGNDRAQRAKSIFGRCKSRSRLEAHIAFVEMRILRLDVRRIGRDEVEAGCRDALVPIGLDELDVEDVKPPRVGA